MCRARNVLFAAALLACGPALSSCQREERNFRPAPAAAETVQWTRVSELYPGTTEPAPPQVEIVMAPGPPGPEYEKNAQALSEGKRLFSAFNCVGCHAHGGGGMGPPLMDDIWIYGHEPEQIFKTIVEGRPNGMPSWGGRIPAYQIWQLVAYVRSLSGLVPKDAAPGRDDHMKANPPENSTKPERPVNSAPPK
jgi:cytochrome c oxidase cbb3-type subunit 3